MSDRARILLHSAGILHPSLRARRALEGALRAAPGIVIEPAGELARFRSCRAPRDRALVAYFHRRRVDDATLGAVEDFVAEGGGLLAVHAASASFKRRPRWHALLGGRFLRHGPVQRFRVEPSPGADPIFSGLGAFEVRDELYRHEWSPENRVHFHTEVEGEVEGQQEPVCWTRTHGRGRVAYLSLGHVADVWNHPTAAELLRRALIWTTTPARPGAGGEGEPPAK